MVQKYFSHVLSTTLKIKELIEETYNKLMFIVLFDKYNVKNEELREKIISDFKRDVRDIQVRSKLLSEFINEEKNEQEIS